MAGDLYVLNAADVRFLRELAVEVRRLGGVTQFRRAIQAGSDGWQWGRVTAFTVGATPLDARNNPVNHTYTIQPVAKAEKGYTITATSKWTAISGVPVIEGAYHFAEDGNTGVGIQMNGIDFDGDIFQGSGLMLKPVPVNAIVRFTFIPVVDGAATIRECWFHQPGTNAIDGTC